MRTLNKQPKKPFFIVSAYLDHRFAESNIERTLELEREIRAMKLPFKVLVGSWKGKKEFSYLVTTDTVKEAHSFGRALADAYEQEAFIVVDSNRNGKCISNYNEIDLGKLVLTDKKLIGDNWSRCPMTDKYYTFNNEDNLKEVSTLLPYFGGR